MTGTLGAPKRGTGQARFGMVIQQQRRRQKKRNCGETSWKPFTGADWKDRLARGDGAPDDEEEEDEPQEEEESEELLSAAGPGPEPAGPSHGGDGSSGRAALAAPSGASSDSW